MTQTARVPGPKPMPDILRKAVPLKLPESRHRLAERVALCDFPRWSVRHALRMLTSVCRGGVPAPSRNPLSGAPLSRPILDFGCAFAHAALAYDARPRWGVRRCADLAFHPLTSPAAGAFMQAYRRRPATHCQEPDPYGQCRTRMRDASRAHALGCTEVYGNCTGVYGFTMVPSGLRRTHPHAALVGPQGEATTTVFYDTSSLGGIGGWFTRVRQHLGRLVPEPVTRPCTDDDRRGADRQQREEGIVGCVASTRAHAKRFGRITSTDGVAVSARRSCGQISDTGDQINCLAEPIAFARPAPLWLPQTDGQAPGFQETGMRPMPLPPNYVWAPTRHSYEAGFGAFVRGQIARACIETCGTMDRFMVTPHPFC